jgi:hypothetical protein
LTTSLGFVERLRINSTVSSPTSLLALTFKLRGRPTTKLGRSPESQKTTDRKECAYGQSLSNAGLDWILVQRRNGASTPALLYPAKRKAATGKKLAEAAPLGCHRRQRRSRQNAPAKTTCPENRMDIGSPPTMTARPKQRWSGRAAVLAVAAMFQLADAQNNAPDYPTPT